MKPNRPLALYQANQDLCQQTMALVHMVQDYAAAALQQPTDE